jgi:hypothetical protein
MKISLQLVHICQSLRRHISPYSPPWEPQIPFSLLVQAENISFGFFFIFLELPFPVVCVLLLADLRHVLSLCEGFAVTAELLLGSAICNYWALVTRKYK